MESGSLAFKAKIIQNARQCKGKGREVLPQLGVYLISNPLSPIIRSSVCVAIHVVVRPIFCTGIWP